MSDILTSLYIIIAALVLYSLPSAREMTPRFRWVGIPFYLLCAVLWPIYLIVSVIIIVNDKRKKEQP